MFEKLEQLAKDNKKISDFHIRSGSPLAYRLTGEIIMEKDTPVTAQDLKDLLSMNCNEEELQKFETTHELDTAINLSGLRFIANFYKTINGPACVCRRVESKIPDMDQFSLPQVLYDIIDMHINYIVKHLWKTKLIHIWNFTLYSSTYTCWSVNSFIKVCYKS